MSVVCQKVSMAECVNCGLGLGSEDLRQGIIPPGPMFADMLLRGMQCVDMKTVPLQNEENCSRTLSLSSRKNQDVFSSVLDNVSNTVDPVQEQCAEDTSDKFSALSNERTEHPSAENTTQVPSTESLLYFLPVNYNKRNLWRRISGFHASSYELRSATYPARTSVKKLRFAQAKKALNYLYSYFSAEILDCDEESSITIGVSRKDYPSKIAPGKGAGSIGYCSDTGSICLRDAVQLDGPRFSKGDVVGCGIIYPSHYKRYADLSTDDNSDGMTDVVLTSLLNKKSMGFVCNVLNLNAQSNDSSSDGDAFHDSIEFEDHTGNCGSDYYNENFVESRTQVEVYFTFNMQVIGKVLSHVPIGGFYPTVHLFSSSAVQMNVDLNPPSSSSSSS